MTTVTLRWIGDLGQDKREQAGCVSSSSDQYRPKKIELRPHQKVIRIGRSNTKSPPDYPVESCINNRMISRNHATIERSAKGGSILYDHSMNGTYVNYTRVMGGVSLKHGDVVCFGHLNGANLKPGDTVALFHSDLKYRVELSDSPPVKKEPTSASNKKKTKTNPPGSTVSSTQQSGDDNSSDSDDSKTLKPSDTKARSKKKTDDSSERRGSTKPLKATPSIKTKLKQEKPPIRKPARNERRKTAGNDDSDDNVAPSEEVCAAKPCKRPQDAEVSWVQCDTCEDWYHQDCVGTTVTDDTNEEYHCPFCKQKET